MGERSLTFTATRGGQAARLRTTTQVTAAGCDVHHDGPYATVTARGPGRFTITVP